MTTRENGSFLELDIKAIGDDGVFTGYASTFGNPDQGRDVMVRGAFTMSLAKKPAARVKMLLQHDQREPVGVWTSLEEDERGLKATGRLILDTVKGRETYSLLKAGALDGLSIGYRTVKDRMDRAKGVRFLEEVDLSEISIVTFPMNEAATVSRVKSASDFASLVAAINGARSALTN